MIKCGVKLLFVKESGELVVDYKDYQTGMTDNHFWVRGKIGLIETLMKKVSINSSLKILCVGVGTGNDLAHLRQFGKIYAIDIDDNALQMVADDFVVQKKQADLCKNHQCSALVLNLSTY